MKLGPEVVERQCYFALQTSAHVSMLGVCAGGCEGAIAAPFWISSWSRMGHELTKENAERGTLDGGGMFNELQCHYFASRARH